MWQINKYVIAAVLKGYFIVTLILVLLFSLILFIEELDNVGTGKYQILDAIRYTILMLPKLLIDLTSFAALIGSIVGLGALAKNSELIAMHAIGISTKHIAKIILFLGIFIMLFIFLTSQYLVPTTTRTAHIGKAMAISDSNNLVDEAGFWARNERVFLHIGNTFLGNILHDIEIFEFDKKNALKRYIHAQDAKVKTNGNWQLYDVTTREYKENIIAESKKDHVAWESFLGSSQTAIINASQQGISITELYKYFNSLKERGEQYYSYELSFWQKVSLPVVAISMMFISLIFMFGSLRGITISSRITVAILMSILFYLLNQIAVHTGSLFQLPPFIVVTLPLLIITAIAFVMLQVNS